MSRSIKGRREKKAENQRQRQRANRKFERMLREQILRYNHCN